MYELIVRHSPLSIFCWMVGLKDVRDPEYSRLLLSHMPIRLPTNIDPNAKALMRELLQDNPRLRIGCRRRGFDELRHHSYFDGVAWENYLEPSVWSKAAHHSEGSKRHSSFSHSVKKRRIKGRPTEDCRHGPKDCIHRKIIRDLSDTARAYYESDSQNKRTATTSIRKRFFSRSKPKVSE